MSQSSVVLCLYPDNSLLLISSLFRILTPIGRRSVSFYFMIHVIVFFQFGFQKCVERCIIGALYSLLPPVERLLFLNVSMGAEVMSQAELDRTEEIKL